MTNPKNSVPLQMLQDTKREPSSSTPNAMPFAHLVGADLSAWHEHQRAQAMSEEDAAAQSVIDAMSAGRSKVQR